MWIGSTTRLGIPQGCDRKTSPETTMTKLQNLNAGIVGEYMQQQAAQVSEDLHYREHHNSTKSKNELQQPAPSCGRISQSFPSVSLG